MVITEHFICLFLAYINVFKKEHELIEKKDIKSVIARVPATRAKRNDDTALTEEKGERPSHQLTG